MNNKLLVAGLGAMTVFSAAGWVRTWNAPSALAAENERIALADVASNHQVRRWAPSPAGASPDVDRRPHDEDRPRLKSRDQRRASAQPVAYSGEPSTERSKKASAAIIGGGAAAGAAVGAMAGGGKGAAIGAIAGGAGGYIYDRETSRRDAPAEREDGTDTLTRVGVGAASGAAIGAIAGGGKGAAIGAAAGGAGGYVYDRIKKRQ